MKMGCFTVLKSKEKKMSDKNKISHATRLNPRGHSPTVLPEPLTQTRALHSAPPSFKIRARPAASSMDEAGQDPTLMSNEFDEYEESRGRVGSTIESISSGSPQPLPLPSPHPTASLKTMGSFKTVNASGGRFNAFSGPLPLPPVTVSSTGSVRNFSYEEIAAACHNFTSELCVSEGLSSVMYSASFGDDAKKLDATITRLSPSSQGLKEFVNEVNTLASLQCSSLCKLLGFHAREGSGHRMLVYERLFHGSLDGLLFGRSGGPPLDWNARMKIALCAAQGLTFLHEEGPFQAMFHEFSTANIQIDKDFSAKLSGYGCVTHIQETGICCNAVVLANLSAEAMERGYPTPKSNVWSFGIVLLELLTGRKNLDCGHPKEEMNLVKWTRPFLADDCRLSLIMDSQLKGRFPAKAARTIADIAQICLHKDPSGRPTMRTIVEQLKAAQDMKYPSRFPLEEPGRVSMKHMSKSHSLNGIVVPPPRLSLSPSPPTTSQPPLSPTRQTGMPLSGRSRTCSYTSLEDLHRLETRRSSTSPVQRSSVEGF
ncbi:unnamed protein product [Cuscuta epithymum]|uniref:Protein kinase domain-containing protein n=1 Tax=Cuscuta epithymum TaxID=186058 RepID=A0AAV0CVC6_9ASTE|nr:unnamed protein product [Cuscuta epithymum]CAH9120892.1 unnamed protein product [Cuscuta epithymum]